MIILIRNRRRNQPYIWFLFQSKIKSFSILKRGTKSLKNENRTVFAANVSILVRNKWRKLLRFTLKFWDDNFSSWEIKKKWTSLFPKEEIGSFMLNWIHIFCRDKTSDEAGLVQKGDRRQLTQWTRKWRFRQCNGRWTEVTALPCCHTAARMLCRNPYLCLCVSVLNDRCTMGQATKKLKCE